MMNFFRRSKRSKSARNHNVMPRSESRELKRGRPTSTQANKALVNKINEVEKPNPSPRIPDVISSHESQSSLEVVKAQISHREARKDSLENARKSVEVPSQITTKSPRDYSEARIPVGGPSVVITESPRDNLEKARKRNTSFTISETDAVGTLDEVLRTFDFDDNLNDVQPEADKHTTLRPNDDDIFAIESPYASIAELGDKPLPKTTAEYETKPIEQLQEPVYAKPIKAKKPTSPNKKTDQNHNILNSSVGRDETDEAPPVPPKRFEIEDNQVKFSDLKKTSPSASLSQSLKKTDWANANEKSTPKRRPKEDNDNYSLKRGKLSKPLPSGKEYIEPPPDYDMNGTVSSTGMSTNFSDDSFTRDNWTGSLTSSSASGSRKVLKVIRPEVLDLVRNKKKTEEAQDGRRHDCLVDRSFRELIKQASLREDVASEASGSDYEAIKNEADWWLAKNERLRANQQGKKKDFTKNSSSSSLQQTTAQSESRSAQGATQPASAPPEKAPKPERGSLKRIATPKSGTPEVTVQPERESYQKTEQVENGSPKTTAQPRIGSFKKEELSTAEDENLVRLMETDVFTEKTRSSTVDEYKDFGYVPRALRMNFGQTWDGIRKDRRAWKSREMNNVAFHSVRKGSKQLSNRLDEQNQELEMLF